MSLTNVSLLIILEKLFILFLNNYLTLSLPRSEKKFPVMSVILYNLVLDQFSIHRLIFSSVLFICLLVTAFIF